MSLPPAPRLPHPGAVRTRRDWIGHALAGALTVAVAGALLLPPPSRAAEPPAPPAPAAPAAPPPDDAPVPPPPPPPRADEKLQREGRSAFADGYLTLLPGFSAPDGTYDVVLHFHGNTQLVEESLAHARINAVFAPQNLGAGSGPYEARFAVPGSLSEVLGRAQAAMERRGLARARLGRVALLAWSAGYGAVERILERADEAERVDAVLLLDGIHIGRVPGRRAPAEDQIAPYERFARWAVEGRKLLTVTHSDIAPDAYVGARDTTDVLLRRLGLGRSADGEEAPIPDLRANQHVLSKAERVPLQPLTVAGRGQLRVRGYAGDEADDHVRHLMAMATIALPDLAAWWARPRDASP
jgi:hypothetical protein